MTLIDRIRAWFGGVPRKSHKPEHTIGPDTDVAGKGAQVSADTRKSETERNLERSARKREG